jgi:hypothetical protein
MKRVNIFYELQQVLHTDRQGNTRDLKLCLNVKDNYTTAGNGFFNS